MFSFNEKIIIKKTLAIAQKANAYRLFSALDQMSTSFQPGQLLRDARVETFLGITAGHNEEVDGYIFLHFHLQNPDQPHLEYQ